MRPGVKYGIPQPVTKGSSHLNRRQIATMTLAVVMAVGTSGCAKTVNHRGWLADDELVADIIPGVDNTSSVEATLGTPSAKSVFGDEVWYYISRTHENVAFFHPNLTEQQIVVVSFDERGTVAEIGELGIDDAKRVNLVDKTTPTRGKELGFFEQIFSNIGRFSGGGGPAQPGN